MSSDPLLRVENLRIILPLGAGPLHAVRGIDFSVSAGETLSIVGESGCGKSLTSLAIMDLLPRIAQRTASRLMFGDTDLTRLRPAEMSSLRGRRMAMIFQEPMTSLNPTYTIGDQLTEVHRRHRKSLRQEARDRAVFLLEKVGISQAATRLGQYPHQLSGGLRQRVMIAMALMCEPDLVIADEPTTALDVTIQAQILRLLKDLQQEFGMAMILITHDLGIVASIADRVAVMYAGEVVESGNASDLFSKPMHPYTQGLLDCVPVPGKQERGAQLGAIPGTVPSLIGEVVGCAFRERCPLAEDACAGPIAVADDGLGHAWRCRVAATDLVQRAKAVAAA